MKYLFFDIECANCCQLAKIFSLGYCITDENFNILHEKEDVLINPRDRFDWYVAKKMMAYPKSIFAKKPPFPDFYQSFKEMFEDEDTTVIGYAVTNDVHFLQDDCKRYNLEPFTYKFYDVQQIYARQPENNEAKNLEDSLLAWCGIEAENMHRSDEDAYNTMLILKAIAAYHHTDLPGILALYPECAGTTCGFTVDYGWKKPEGEKKPRKRHRGAKDKKLDPAEEHRGNCMEAGSENAERFVKYLKAVRPRPNRKEPPYLAGHTVTISLAYQRYHYNEMLYLVQMIVDAGGRYTLKTADADTLYTYGDEQEDTRLAAMKARMEAGEDLDILPLKTLFETFDTGEMRLANKPKKDISALIGEEKKEEKAPIFASEECDGSGVFDLPDLSDIPADEEENGGNSEKSGENQ